MDEEKKTVKAAGHAGRAMHGDHDPAPAMRAEQEARRGEDKPGRPEDSGCESAYLRRA